MNSTEQQIAPLPPSMAERTGLRWPSQWRQPGFMVLSGSIIMLMGSGMVSVANFGYNVAMARLLGPAEFGHLASVATLLLMASAITLSFQLVCAKFVARNTSEGGKALIYHGLMRRAWVMGVLVGVGMMLSSQFISSVLRLPSPMLIVLLGASLAIFPAIGVKRGALQGSCAFQQLSVNFVVEAVVKLVAALLLVALGYGVFGAVGGIVISLLVAYAYPGMRFSKTARVDHVIPASFREGMQAIVFFVGQVVLSNIDILLVKYFFSATDAGLYAAVALVGRVLYFAAWSIVSAMFPVSASSVVADDRPNHVLFTPLLLVFVISVVFTLGMAIFPSNIVALLFGKGFQQAEPLLSLYAMATGFYALAVVLMTYEMSRKIANTGWLQLVFGGVLVLAISLLHQSLRQVVMIQLVIMATLLVAVSLPFLRQLSRGQSQIKEAA